MSFFSANSRDTKGDANEFEWDTQRSHRELSENRFSFSVLLIILSRGISFVAQLTDQGISSEMHFSLLSLASTNVLSSLNLVLCPCDVYLLWGLQHSPMMMLLG